MNHLFLFDIFFLNIKIPETNRLVHENIQLMLIEQRQLNYPSANWASFFLILGWFQNYS